MSQGLRAYTRPGSELAKAEEACDRRGRQRHVTWPGLHPEARGMSAGQTFRKRGSRGPEE